MKFKVSSYFFDPMTETLTDRRQDAKRQKSYEVYSQSTNSSVEEPLLSRTASTCRIEYVGVLTSGAPEDNPI